MRVRVGGGPKSPPWRVGTRALSRRALSSSRARAGEPTGARRGAAPAWVEPMDVRFALERLRAAPAAARMCKGREKLET